MTARERMHPGALAYFEAGAGAQRTRDEAEQAWARYRLRPHALVDVGDVDVRTELFGAELTGPFLAGPSALHALAHPDGEVATARGVAAAGGLMAVSTSCSVPLGDVADVAGPWWFQVYTRRDPGIHRGLAAYARDLGASALVLTGDMPVTTSKPGVDLSQVPGVDRMLAVNTDRHVAADAPASAREQSPAATEEVIGELADLTGLPVLVKGVLRGDDATRMVDAGAAGVIVSNHGGRQLDRAASTALCLPDVVAAIGNRVPVLVDGGIRSGLDALTALALGARAVLLGRPVLWALAAGGADAVRDLFDLLTADLKHTMALAGVPTPAALTPDLVQPS